MMPKPTVRNVLVYLGATIAVAGFVWWLVGCKATAEAVVAAPAKLLQPPPSPPDAEHAASWLAWPFAISGAILCLVGGIGMMLGFGARALVAGLAIGGAMVGLFLFWESASPVVPWIAGGAGVLGLAWGAYMLGIWTLGVRARSRAKWLRNGVAVEGVGVLTAGDPVVAGEARALDWVGPKFRRKAKFKLRKK